MLEQISSDQYTEGLVLADGFGDDPVSLIIAEEVATINEMYRLPEPVTVSVAPCGEANAFYYSYDRTITICTEYAEDLARVWAESE